AWAIGHDAYRKMVGHEAGEKDVSWRTTMQQSAKLAISVLGGCLFNVDFGLQIQRRKIQGSPAGGIIDRSPLKEKMDAIYAALVADLVDPDEEGEFTGNPVKSKLTDPNVQDLLKPFSDFVRNRYTRVVKLIVDPGSSTGVAEALSTWWKGLDMAPGSDQNIAVIYDTELSGHPNGRGHLRINPFRGQHYDRMIKGWLAALFRDDQPKYEMPWNVIYNIFDGGVHGNDAKFGKAFQSKDGKALKKDKGIPPLQTSEKSLNKTKGNYSGVYGLPTMEFVSQFSKASNLPEKKKLHSEGTNKDPVIGKFDKPAKTDALTWLAKHSDEPILYGSAWTLAAGAVAGDDAKADSGPKGKDMAPFN
ncbi:unnamed protein product, partial [Prorocentrum cordatum]